MRTRAHNLRECRGVGLAGYPVMSTLWLIDRSSLPLLPAFPPTSLPYLSFQLYPSPYPPHLSTTYQPDLSYHLLSQPLLPTSPPYLSSLPLLPTPEEDLEFLCFVVFLKNCGYGDAGHGSKSLTWVRRWVMRSHNKQTKNQENAKIRQQCSKL